MPLLPGKCLTNSCTEGSVQQQLDGKQQGPSVLVYLYTTRTATAEA